MAKLTLEGWAVRVAEAGDVPEVERLRRDARRISDAGLRESVLDLLAKRQLELEGWGV